MVSWVTSKKGSGQLPYLGGAAAVLISAVAMGATLGLASSTTTRLTAEADAFVASTAPDSNMGAGQTLRIRNDLKRSYFRFDISGLPARERITSATFKVFATSGPKCSRGAELLRAARGAWGEETITWNNQPGITGEPLATVGSWTSNTYVSFNVTSAVAGNGGISFVLRHAAGCNATSAATLQSREALNEPLLVVKTKPAPQCSDGIDNDSDGLTDFQADPGCTDPGDNDETDPVVVAAAGDIVCDPDKPNYDGHDPAFCQHRKTDDLLVGADAVVPLGDLQYSDGSLDKFLEAYDPTWGRQAVSTFPVPGNHEYNDPAGDAMGYFNYWAGKGRPVGDGNGYYSFDLGAWHLIALNTSEGCQREPFCEEGTPQNDFLEQDLATTTKPCIAAYWHHPLFNSGAVHGDDTRYTDEVRALWRDLYAARADIILNGHEHNYQRYSKQNPKGQSTGDGVREFIVGSGGSRHYELLETKDPNYEFGNETDFGVLRLTLDRTSYSWEFVNVDGAVIDSGGPVPCN